ncbi:MAG: hypothetical protein ABW223_01260 [Rariglobus sp.]
MMVFAGILVAIAVLLFLFVQALKSPAEETSDGETDDSQPPKDADASTNEGDSTDGSSS